MADQYLSRKQLTKYSKLSVAGVKWKLYEAPDPSLHGVTVIGGVKMVPIKKFVDPKYGWQPNAEFYKDFPQYENKSLTN